jgi:hypothetical protein
MPGYLNEASVYYGTGDSLIPASRLKDGYHTDWFDDLLREGFMQSHNVSLSGGNEKITYFLSMGFNQEDGILETNDYKRFTIRTNNEYKISKDLKLGALVSFSRYDQRDADVGNFNNAYRSAPYVPSKIGDKYGNTSEAGNVGNPFLNLEKQNNTLKDNKLQGTFYLEYKPISSLTLKSSFGVDLDFFDQTNYLYSYPSDTTTFLTAGGNQQRPRSSLGVTSNNTRRWLWENTATWKETFDKHEITALVGYTAEELTSSSLFGTRTDVPPDPNLWFLATGSTDPLTLSNNNTGDKWTETPTWEG